MASLTGCHKKVMKEVPSVTETWPIKMKTVGMAVSGDILGRSI